MPHFIRMLIGLAVALPAAAHFQVLIPSADNVQSAEQRNVTFDIRFTHPMAGGPPMAMGPPVQFGVLVGGKKTDLLPQLQAKEIESQPAYTASYELNEPGAHVFYLEPAPYYEVDENTFIIHYTKVVVDGFNSWSGWDRLVGFPAEIRPLTRPYGLWAGNSFQGIVLRDGKPVPFANVEIERLNDDKALAVPSPAFETQVIKSDAQGVFTYTMPVAGWWGFAALIHNRASMKSPNGETAKIELGAVIWIYATPIDVQSPASPGGE